MEGTAVAAAVGIAALNVLRLVQVRQRIGIQPYERAYLALIVPAAAALIAAVGAHAALSGSTWWVSLVATGACGFAVYLILLPVALTTDERELIRRIPSWLKTGRAPTPSS
jgi:hypothetical protein